MLRFAHQTLRQTVPEEHTIESLAARLAAIEAADVISDDATSNALLTLIGNLNARVTGQNLLRTFMKKKATEDQFNELHNLVTTEFLSRIKSGGGFYSRLESSFCDWLKANDISGVQLDGTPLDKLAKLVPTVDPEMVQQRLYRTNR